MKFFIILIGVYLSLIQNSLSSEIIKVSNKIFIGIKENVKVNHKTRPDLCYIENMSKLQNGFAVIRGIGLAYANNTIIFNVVGFLAVSKTENLMPTHFLEHDLNNQMDWTKLEQKSMFFTTGNKALEVLQEYVQMELSLMDKLRNNLDFNKYDSPTLTFNHDGKTYLVPMILQEMKKFHDCFNELQKKIITDYKK